MGLAYALNFARTFLVQAALFYFPLLLLAERGLAGWQLGACTAAHALAGLFLSAPLGMAADRLGPRRMLSAGLVALGAGYGALAVAHGFAAHMACFLLLGSGVQATAGATHAFVYKSMGPARPGRSLGHYSASSSLAIAAGMLAGGQALSALGWPRFLGATAALFVVLALAALGLAEPPHHTAAARAYWRDLGRPGVPAFALLVGLFATHWGAEMTAYVPYLRDVVGLSTEGCGLFMAPPILLLTAFAYIFARRVDRGRSLHGALAFAMFVSGVGNVGMALSKAVPAALAWRTLHECGDGAFAIFLLVGTRRLFDVERIGGNAGAIHLVTLAGAGLGALAYGPLGTRLGFAWPHLAAGVLSVLCGCAVAAAYRDPTPSPEVQHARS